MKIYRYTGMCYSVKEILSGTNAQNVSLVIAIQGKSYRSGLPRTFISTGLPRLDHLYSLLYYSSEGGIQKTTTHFAQMPWVVIRHSS